MFTEELNNKFLLVKNYRKQNVSHNASLWDNVQLLGRIWKWPQEQQTPEPVNNRLLLIRNKYGQTAGHLTAYKDTIEVLDYYGSGLNKY